MQANDELVALFQRNLSLEQPQAPAPAPQQAAQPEPIIYSITQHYTHSAHVLRDEEPEQVPRRSSEPPQASQPSAEMVLFQHGVNPALLSSTQLELFKTADDAQKTRLVELWSICPPSGGSDPSNNNPQQMLALAIEGTTLEQEEFLARMRFQRSWEENEQRRNMMMEDSAAVPSIYSNPNSNRNSSISASSNDGPLTPVQTGEGRWAAASEAMMEPYMLSGYEELARREYEETIRQQQQQQMMMEKEACGGFHHHLAASPTSCYRPAMDPVYGGGPAADWARRQQAMEDQYGSFQQMEAEMEL